MSAANIPSGTSQFSSSMPSIDDLLHQYKAQSAWKLISMPNLTTLCHEQKCDKCSTYLEHLLIGAHTGELCAHPAGLEGWLDHAWPATMNDIHRDVGEPLAESPKSLTSLATSAMSRMTRSTTISRRSMTCMTSSPRSIVFDAGSRNGFPSTRASRKRNWRRQWVLHCHTNARQPEPCHHPHCQQYTCQQIYLQW